jgi:hypothetical protein
VRGAQEVPTVPDLLVRAERQRRLVDLQRAGLVLRHGNAMLHRQIMRVR